MGDEAQVTLISSGVFGNDHGIIVKESAQVAVGSSEVSSNISIGLIVGNSAHLTLTNSQISRNSNGLKLEDSGQLEASGSIIQGNACHGLLVTDNAQVILEDSMIKENSLFCPPGHGAVEIEDSAIAIIRGTAILVNKNFGVEVGDQAQVIMGDNAIQDNDSWGVTLFQAPCVETEEVFAGKVEGKGNVIEGNGKELSEEQKQAGDGVGEVCPKALEFLMTEEGGQYP